MSRDRLSCDKRRTGDQAVQFKSSQWIVEIGFGIGLLLLSSTALMLAMQHNSEIPELNRTSGSWFDRYFNPPQLARQVVVPLDDNP